MKLLPSRPLSGKLTAAFLSSLLSSHPPPDLFFIFAAAVSFLIIAKNPFFTPPPRLQLRRRSIQFPAMNRVSHSSSPSLAFSTPETLSDWLKPRLPPGALASWGVSPGTKTLNNLFLELSQGETFLFLHPVSSDLPSEKEEEKQQPTPPLRSVHVATIKIRNQLGAFLVETHQLLSDGSIRRRGRLPSEKMRPEETVEDATLRAVEEELGVSSNSVRILPDSYAVRIEEKASSASYPGLPARYILHSIDADVGGFPEEGEFSTEEKGEGGGESSFGSAVFVKRHYWKWVYDLDGSTGNDFKNSSS